MQNPVPWIPYLEILTLSKPVGNISWFTRLRELWLYFDTKVDCDPLTTLTNLTELHLANRIDNISALTSLNKIEVLEMWIEDCDYNWRTATIIKLFQH